MGELRRCLGCLICLLGAVSSLLAAEVAAYVVLSITSPPSAGCAGLLKCKLRNAELLCFSNWGPVCAPQVLLRHALAGHAAAAVCGDSRHGQHHHVCAVRVVREELRAAPQGKGQRMPSLRSHLFSPMSCAECTRRHRQCSVEAAPSDAPFVTALLPAPSQLRPAGC